MNETNNRDSIMRMARGAFEERVDYEMDKVIQNILDPNTKATAKRKITLTIELGHRRRQRRARRCRDGAAGARATEHGRDAAGAAETPQARHSRITA